MAHAPGPDSPISGLPEERIDRWVAPIRRFMQIETAAGFVLMACTAVALYIANSEWAPGFHELLQTEVGVTFGGDRLLFPLEVWINDGLMTVFFFVVGLEIKREFVLGELRDPKHAALPLAAALGGMIVPAAIYLSLQVGEPGERGWGIPMATDIAFVVGVLSLLGRIVPHSLRVLLLTLAIADDVGAVIVIAIGYTDHIQMLALVLGFIGFGFCQLINWAGVRNVWIYFVMGAVIWFLFHESGVHSTVAGVILGMITPTNAWLPVGRFARTIREVDDFLDEEGTWYNDAHRNHVLQTVSLTARESMPPLERLENALHPWVSFVIMPLFALANAGVAIHMGALTQPISVAVAAGLLLGKPVGVVAASWLAIRSGIARLPSDLDWPAIVAGGFLAGIGFTMALFIAGLALDGEMLESAKVGILMGSTASAVIGLTLLAIVLRRGKEKLDA
jgi:NhaA family Na+:H+ antiporter